MNDKRERKNASVGQKAGKKKNEYVRTFLKKTVERLNVPSPRKGKRAKKKRTTKRGGSYGQTEGEGDFVISATKLNKKKGARGHGQFVAI